MARGPSLANNLTCFIRNESRKVRLIKKRYLLSGEGCVVVFPAELTINRQMSIDGKPLCGKGKEKQLHVLLWIGGAVYLELKSILHA